VNESPVSDASVKLGRAIRWSFVLNGGLQLGNALTTFVLASKVGPEKFGLVALANLFVLFQQMILDPGVTSALVQRREISKAHLDSAFWGLCGTSVVLTSICILAAGWWADWNREEALVPLVRVLAVAIPLQGLALVQQAVLMRELDFRSLAVRTNAGILCGAIVGISMAFAGMEEWSIVGQHLTIAAANLLLIWRLSSWRPGFSVRWSAIRELLPFSFGVFLQRLGNFAYAHADTAVMGYWFGKHAVGLYRFSFRLLNMGIDTGSRAVNMASLPAFARSQDDKQALSEAAVQCLRITSVVTVSLLAMLAANIDFLLPVLETKWTDAALPIKLLVVAGVGQITAMLATPLLQAVGRSYTVGVLSWVWGGVTVASSILVARALHEHDAGEQVTGIALARTVIALLLHVPVYAYVLRKVSGIGVVDTLRIMGPVLVAGSAAVATGFALGASGLLAIFPAFVAFLVAVLVDGTVLVAALVLLDPFVRRIVRRMVRVFVKRSASRAAAVPDVEPR